MRHLFKTYVLLIVFLSTILTIQAADVRIYGSIKDANGKSLPYITVRLQGTTKGCITDNKGNFSFIGQTQDQTLLISAIGYKDISIQLNDRIQFPLYLTMYDADYSIEEVVIRPTHEQYRKKGNPAVELMEQVLDNKDRYDVKKFDLYSRDRYENLLVALENFDQEKQAKLMRSFPNVKDHIDTSLVSGKPILNISVRESALTDYYQKSPHKERTLVKGRLWTGIDDFMPADEMRQRVDILFSDIDLFNEKVFILRQEFVSPVSRMGLTFYKYYIMDTVKIDNQECIDMAFVPRTPESFGFTGHIYITNDTTHFTKWIQLSVPKNSNVNFVKYMNIDQFFEPGPDNTRIMSSQAFTSEMELYEFIEGLYLRREVSYSNYKFNDDVDITLLSGNEEVTELSNAKDQNADFWNEQMPKDSVLQEKILKKRNSVSSLVENLRSHKLYRITEKFFYYAFAGFVPVTKEEPTPFYAGPLNTTISVNGLEGARFRIGGMTGSKFSRHLFLRGYVAYGVNDNRFKYMASAEYSFKAKDQSNAFPVHSIKISSEDDIYQYGQQYITNKDNLLLSLRRRPDNKIGYVNKQELTYTKEFNSHFTFALTARYRSNYTSRFIQFNQIVNSDTIHHKYLNQSEIEFNLRYAPGEQFIQKKWDRKNVDTKWPIITLTHTMSKSGFLNSDYTYQKTQASYSQRLYMSWFGYTDIIIKGGWIWGQVPYPLLFLPNANLSYTIRTESFELMDPMEFIFDRYVQWDIEHDFKGFFFNKIPGVKKLNLREILVFKGIYGKLSNKNNPRVCTDGIYLLPDRVIANTMDIPYMEIGAGIDNIFKMFRIDYYHRLTYKNVPNVDKWGIRIKMQIAL